MPSVCSICTTSEENRPVNGVVPDMPTGWSITTIAERGRHVRNFLLCRVCTSAVRSTMSRLGEVFRDGLERRVAL